MDKKEKLQAIQNRDKSYDGKFIFGVKTTKIVCRPGCPARIPLEKNIVFFDTCICISRNIFADLYSAYRDSLYGNYSLVKE